MTFNSIDTNSTDERCAFLAENNYLRLSIIFFSNSDHITRIELKYAYKWQPYYILLK